MDIIPAEIIKKKRDGKALTDLEISAFIKAYADDAIPDYQMSALLMAIFLQGMTDIESLSLTKSMLHSGTVLDFSDLPFPKVDKHSTGGVGDKTSLILGPIVAACGVGVPMISGRGLGHTGGTLDKLESIPGFNTQLSLTRFKELIAKNKISFIGQTKEICPADKKIYALRDVTATVESLPLICASIMSKKLAEGIDSLVLDVKFGSGAFMKTRENAEQLAISLSKIAKGYGKKIGAFLTNMNQPLGQFAGNALEVEECLSILRGEKHPSYADTYELSILLAAKMLQLTSVEASLEAAMSTAEKALTSGRAYEKFAEMCQAQGGDLMRLPRSKNRLVAAAKSAGYISELDTEKIGIVGIKIKAGRSVLTDQIEPTAGIEFHAKVGAHVKVGDPIFTLYGANLDLLAAAQNLLLSSVKYSDQAPKTEALVWKEIS